MGDWISTMNEYGRREIPFLFILDFELQKPVVIPLADMPDDILYKLNDVKNYELHGTKSKPLIFNPIPVNYDTYSKAFEGVLKEILLGNSFLLNLTFPTKVESNYTLRSLFDISRAKYKLYFKDQFIVSSPEIFVQIKDGKICTFPMKGTIVQTEKDYLEDLLLYNALLKRRNMVLKSFSDQKRVDDLLLESISSAMYAPGQRIHDRRKLYTEQMMPVFADIYREISNDREKCNIRYESQLSMDSLHNLFAKNKDKDLILTRTTQGIHKDDLIFTMNDEPLRNYASQGQLKSFVLALKLTQYHLLQLHTGIPPILLLDDIFDKLDPYRVHQLLAMLIQKDYGQLFITDTQPDRIIKILQEIGTDYYNFHVDNGSVQLVSSENTHDHAPQ